MTDELDTRIAARAHQHGLRLDRAAAASISRYLRLLARWNERMNLTAHSLRGFPDAALDRLVMEPVSAARWVPDTAQTWLDVGSGGGSPAVPMKLVVPRLQLTMVESSLRKAAFLREVVRILNLTGTAVAAQRVETLAADMAADVVTVRAVRADPDFQSVLARLVLVGGRLLHFHSATSQVIDWERLVRESERQLPSARAVLTVWRRSTPG